MATKDAKEVPDVTKTTEKPESDSPTPKPKNHRLRAFLKSRWTKIALAVVVVIGVVLAIPVTRYAVIGLFVNKAVTITVVDKTTDTPVSNATVHLANQSATTNSKGVAVVNHTPVGNYSLSVEKKYYKTATAAYTVPIFGQATTKVTLSATGRIAEITVKNAISGKAVAGATVKIGDTTAVSNETGVANVALAVKDGDQTGTVSLGGFRTSDISINTKDVAPSSTVQLVPEGMVYFMSNRTGSYDVMSAALDGTNQQVLVKGTGQEVAYELQLTPSTNRNYLAYVTRRDGDTTANLYVITTAGGTLVKVENSADASVLGWIGNTVYFAVYNYTTVSDKRSQLVAYTADTKQRTAIDSSHLEEATPYNYAEQSLNSYQLVGNRIYYAKCWSYVAYGGSQDRTASLMAVIDGKAVSLKDVPQNGQAYCDTVASKPNIIYYRLSYSLDNHTDSYRYQPGKGVESVQMNDSELYNNRYTYLASPNSEKTYWTETRDGKAVTFIGDANGTNEAQVSGADYTAYGWFGNDYVLYSKNGSELYVAATGAPLDGAHKVTDYFSQRPQGY